MESQKNNRGIIILLTVIIVILLILCVLFATETISFKSNKVDNDPKQNISNNNCDKTGDNIINKLIGSYTYKGEYVDEEMNKPGEDFTDNDAFTSGKMTYEELKLDDSGYAEASAGNVRASGYNAKGKWYVSNNELIIVNEQCQAVVINNEVAYPNCNPIWTYTLKEENGTLVLTSNNNSMTTITLNKVNN